MPLSPGQFRLAAALAVGGLLGGAIYWVGRYPTPAGRRPLPPPSGFRPVGPAGRAMVEGDVVGLDGKPAHAEVTVLTEANQMPVRGGQARGRRLGETLTDAGRFSLPSLAPGHYVVVARAALADETAESASLWAAAEVDPTDDRPATVRLQLRRSASLAGQITLLPSAGTTSLDLTNVMVTLDPADGEAKAALLDGLPRAYATASGHFLLPDVPPGHYRLTAEIGAPWIVDRVTAAGHDGLDAPIAIGSGAYLSDLTVAATDVPSLVEGQALGPDGRAAPFALVFAFGADPATRPSRRIQAVRANAMGRFTVTGLPSGEYLVGIAAGADPSAWYSPAFFAQLTPGATHVRVSAGTTQTAIVGGRPK
jgi:hypothetical protein